MPVWDAEDGLVPAAVGEAYRTLILKSRLVVLPQAGPPRSTNRRTPSSPRSTISSVEFKNP